MNVSNQQILILQNKVSFLNIHFLVALPLKQYILPNKRYYGFDYKIKTCDTMVSTEIHLQVPEQVLNLFTTFV